MPRHRQDPNAPLDADKAITSGMGPGTIVKSADKVSSLEGTAKSSAMVHQSDGPVPPGQTMKIPTR